MRKSIGAGLCALVLIAGVPTIAYADTASPTPSSTAKPPLKHGPSQAQKIAIAAAKSAFAAAKIDAKNGVDRALADAKAVRDQAILAAGTDKNAVAAAKKSYKESVQTIVIAFKTYMANAKATLAGALAAASSL